MIVELLLSLVKNILFFVFSPLKLPSLPTEMITSVNSFLDLIFSNLDILGFFIRPSTFSIFIPIIIILINFNKIYSVFMWILKKVPFLNIQ